MGTPIRDLILVLIVFAIPLLLARSTAMVLANVVICFITFFGAGLLLLSAGDTPYECFTQAGTYEDHTSGLEGFTLWLLLAANLSALLLLIDLTIWCIKKLRAFIALPQP